jgi:anti-sigma factor RsiW
MDHAFIDRHDIAGRYLRKELSEAERDAFQAHLVDCQECVDRVLLAEMFQKEMPPPLAAPPPEPGATRNSGEPALKLPLRARVIAYLTPWQIAFLLILGVVLILAVPGVWIWWELSRANVR